LASPPTRCTRSRSAGPRWPPATGGRPSADADLTVYLDTALMALAAGVRSQFLRSQAEEILACDFFRVDLLDGTQPTS
jgi:hypothetical protein